MRKVERPSLDDERRMSLVSDIPGGKTTPEDVSMPEIAERLNVSYTKFRRLFKEYTGMSPAQYFINLKIHRAKEMLRGSNASVKEISIILHFENPNHFTALFKNKTGLTPSEYRTM